MNDVAVGLYIFTSQEQCTRIGLTPSLSTLGTVFPVTVTSGDVKWYLCTSVMYISPVAYHGKYLSFPLTFLFSLLALPFVVCFPLTHHLKVVWAGLELSQSRRRP